MIFIIIIIIPRFEEGGGLRNFREFTLYKLRGATGCYIAETKGHTAFPSPQNWER